MWGEEENMFRQQISLVFALSCLAIFGCEDDGPQSCVNSGDCPLPSVCIPLETDEGGTIVRGVCGTDCRVDTDCESGEFCIDSVCQSADRPCLMQSDCEPFGRTCIAGILRCVQRCTSSVACPRGTYCEGGYCLPEGVDATLISTDPVDAGVGTSRDRGLEPRRDMQVTSRMDVGSLIPQDMAVRDRAMPPPDMRVVDARVPDMMVPSGSQYGEPCSRGSDCATNLCIPNAYNNFIGTCTQNCSVASDCPGLHSCGRVMGTDGQETRVCVVNESGQSCSPNGTTAQCFFHGICNNPPNPAPTDVAVQSQCASECQTATDCPAGYTCQATNVGNRTASICSPAVDIRQCAGSNEFCGGVCPTRGGVSELDVAHCVSFGTGGGMCTCECNSSEDCPLGFACDAVSPVPFQLTSGRPGLCYPISGYSCNDSNNCLAAACITVDAQVTRNVCTSQCRSAADCPTNYSCAVDPSLGARVCVPNN